MNSQSTPAWPDELFRALRALDVRQIAYVPDAGHKQLLNQALAEPSIEAIALTTEQEGVALAAGAWLGGQRAAVLMQSSGLGNCVNAIASITRACQFPLLMLITMRGEWGEGNPWQVPMGTALAPVLDTMGVHLNRLEDPGAAYATLHAAGTQCFAGGGPAALLISQRLIGAKAFVE
jgi:sulfopyruvate decarboxylase alpha subunit